MVHSCNEFVNPFLEMALTHLCLPSTKGTLANSVDPDQTPQNAASDKGLHCSHLPLKCQENLHLKMSSVYVVC